MECRFWKEAIHILFTAEFLAAVTTNKETSNNFQSAKSSEEVSTADPVEAHQRLAHVSPWKRKQNR